MAALSPGFCCNRNASSFALSRKSLEKAFARVTVVSLFTSTGFACFVLQSAKRKTAVMKKQKHLSM
jgi:hypothetical protein